MAKELSTYFEIMLNKRPSRVKTASMINAREKDDINSLWREHETIKAGFKKIFDKKTFYGAKKPDFSYMDLKIKIAEKIFENCYFCERRCYVNRNTNTGFCGVLNSRIASEYLHIGEEAPLVPSHTIFFAGCNFKCIYCQNFDISQFPESGIEISEKSLSKIIDRRRREGSRNVNFVGGDPTPNLPFILKTMHLCNENIPVVWNSNFYMSKESMKLLDGFVDLYLTDFKYGPCSCAVELSGVSDYWNIVTRNHKMAKNACDMIIRHLVLPNHVECCSKPILKWIRDNLGKETVVNIMGQYRPVYKAQECKEIRGFPSHQEIQETINYAKRLGLLNII
ncbi:radical SAM protein [Methanobacterium sp.]|uniref:radical SAM protein n=1 Tax=Methanobacterium sp. TaxID=2164 RepID=UPI003D6469CD